jgi:ribosomal protein S18 acetylase RimI-like enzyme
MNNMIPRYHMIMDKDTFQLKKRAGKFNGFYQSLSHSEIKCDVDKFLFLLKKVGGPWHWHNIAKYKDTKNLTEKLKTPNTKVHYILDNMRVIGYFMTVKPNLNSLSQLSNKDLNGKNIIEIENIGLFPEQAGQGRGLKILEMVFDDLFRKHDAIYLSMTSTNHSGMFNFYTKKLGMEFFATNYAPDPRPQELQKIAA